MKVVASGSKYADIDVYGGCIAYADLLNLQGHESIAVSTAPTNESVTESIRGLGVGFSDYQPTIKDTFVMIDVSNPNFFDKFVVVDRVEEIIDHHPGHEEYWAARPEVNAQIELVGAACTQVFERWQQAELEQSIRPEVATMLAAGILDNTLNFTAGVTSDRDVAAYSKLIELGGLRDSFAADYFGEVQVGIEEGLSAAIVNDAKHMTETTELPEHLGQLVVWDAKSILTDRLDDIAQPMRDMGDDWAINVVSIGDNTTHIVAENPATQQKFIKLLDVEFEGTVSSPIKSLLRKEILKKALVS